VASEIVPSFERLVAEYKNTAEHNDFLYKKLTDSTSADPTLRAHRSYVEQNKLGFGDPAFHAMWLRLMSFASRRFGTVSALEIGVFKGQVISLWAVIARQWNFNVRIDAITPLAGNLIPKSKLIMWLRSHFDSKFRECLINGNLYADEDYPTVIKQLFQHFNVDFDTVKLHHGYSTDQHILKSLSDSKFHVIYVDGDHTFEGALHDFKTFGPKVALGGWLIADDAGISLPGSLFWKGYPAVSRAAAVLPELGFRNVLNVGHNRIFERVE
jgi:Methyltransferase domain